MSYIKKKNAALILGLEAVFKVTATHGFLTKSVKNSHLATRDLQLLLPIFSNKKSQNLYAPSVNILAVSTYVYHSFLLWNKCFFYYNLFNNQRSWLQWLVILLQLVSPVIP